jgi:uncharacterized protein with gpF-like domain
MPPIQSNKALCLRAPKPPGDPPKRAVDYFRKKGIKPSFNYRSVWGKEHAHAFTAAGAMADELLEALREEVDRSLDEGLTFEDFKKELKPKLERMGWWGEREITDPKTGRTRTVNFGSPSRLEKIYFHNMRTSRVVGQWARTQRTKDVLPFLVYQLGPAEKHRDLHVQWDGTMLPADDSWWLDHMPPNGWNCHCHVRQLGPREVEKRGGESRRPPSRDVEMINPSTGKKEMVPVGIDPGWNYNPGTERYNPTTKKLEPV